MKRPVVPSSLCESKNTFCSKRSYMCRKMSTFTAFSFVQSRTQLIFFFPRKVLYLFRSYVRA